MGAQWISLRSIDTIFSRPFTWNPIWISFQLSRATRIPNSNCIRETSIFVVFDLIQSSVSDIGGNDEVIAILQNPSFSFFDKVLRIFLFLRAIWLLLRRRTPTTTTEFWIFKICMRLHARSLTETKIACWELSIAEIASTFRSKSSQDVVAYRIDGEKFVIPFYHSKSKVFLLLALDSWETGDGMRARIHQFEVSFRLTFPVPELNYYYHRWDSALAIRATLRR